VQSASDVQLALVFEQYSPPEQVPEPQSESVSHDVITQLAKLLCSQISE
jgi:hypothetical protein